MTLELPKSIVYVARDIERALGMAPGQYGKGGYYIVSNDTAYGREVTGRYPGYVFLVARKVGGATVAALAASRRAEQLDTYDLLCLPEVEEIIENLAADVLVFQNTARIERRAAEKKWRLLNPSAALAKTVEEKISQVAWLGEDANLLPPHQIKLIKDVSFKEEARGGAAKGSGRFVLQFNHAHTGLGTYIIDSPTALAKLAEKFHNRECRITDFVEGPVFTVNAVVQAPESAALSGATTTIGNPSYQITGLAPFTDLPFATIGNDWTLPQTTNYKQTYEDTKKIAQTVGDRLARSGWKGLFGIDVVFNGNSVKKTYLLEINARQPASTVFESQLQKNNTVFENHLLALIGKSTQKTTSTISGAQIVKRITNKPYTVDIETLRTKNFTVIEYENTEHNQELFRIQSTLGIMKAHNELGDNGTFIQSCIKPKKN